MAGAVPLQAGQQAETTCAGPPQWVPDDSGSALVHCSPSGISSTPACGCRWSTTRWVVGWGGVGWGCRLALRLGAPGWRGCLAPPRLLGCLPTRCHCGLPAHSLPTLLPPTPARCTRWRQTAWWATARWVGGSRWWCTSRGTSPSGGRSQAGRGTSSCAAWRRRRGSDDASCSGWCSAPRGASTTSEHFCQLLLLKYL